MVGLAIRPTAARLPQLVNSEWFTSMVRCSLRSSLASFHRNLPTHVVKDDDEHPVKFWLAPEWFGRQCETGFLCSLLIDGVTASRTVISIGVPDHFGALRASVIGT